MELQLAIWAYAAALNPEPEVCVVWPLKIEGYTSPPEQPALPFIVDTAWPAAAHVCRAARAVVFASGALRLRHSPLAGFAVPYRLFIPEIDTLYVGRNQIGAVLEQFFSRPKNAHFARALRHVALEVSAADNYRSALAPFIWQRAVNVRTLSLVLASSTATEFLPYRLAFLPPVRRCRLREISGDALDKIVAKDVWVSGSISDRQTMPLPRYLEVTRQRMDYHARNFPMVAWNGECAAWSAADDSFSGLEFKAQTFVEYAGTASAGDNEERWVEVCESRKLWESAGGSIELRDDDMETTRAPYPRHIPVVDRKNPEEYRGLDDDGSWYSFAEYKAEMQLKLDEDVREARARFARGETDRVADPFSDNYAFFA